MQDGNACDQTGAYFELPVTAANCANCNGATLPAPTFTEYEVRARVLGKPPGRSTITSCVEMLEIDATGAQVATALCSVGAQNIFVGTRNAGNGSAQNRWENVSAQLLTVCVDKSGDGVCDDRIGLFDSSGKDYWWSFDNGGRPHVQLVFFPVRPGSGRAPIRRPSPFLTRLQTRPRSSTNGSLSAASGIALAVGSAATRDYNETSFGEVGP